MLKLSILIPTVDSRRSLLSRLLWTLQPQLVPEVEVVIHASDSLPIGQKFNELYNAAEGRLSVQLDDDDLVAADYVQAVLPHADADYIGYKSLYTENGVYRETYESDPQRGTHQSFHVGLIVRHVSQKCPILTTEARKHTFSSDWGGDFHWISALVANGYPLSSVFIDRVLYHYDFWEGRGLWSRGSLPQRDLGAWPYDEHAFRWIGVG
jgi:hypothetical protein